MPRRSSCSWASPYAFLRASALLSAVRSSPRTQGSERTGHVTGSTAPPIHPASAESEKWPFQLLISDLTLSLTELRSKPSNGNCCSMVSLKE